MKTIFSLIIILTIPFFSISQEPINITMYSANQLIQTIIEETGSEKVSNTVDVNKEFLEIDYPQGRAIELHLGFARYGFRRFHFGLKVKNRNSIILDSRFRGNNIFVEPRCRASGNSF